MALVQESEGTDKRKTFAEEWDGVHAYNSLRSIKIQVEQNELLTEDEKQKILSIVNERLKAAV